MKKLNFQAKILPFLGSSPSKIYGHIQNVFIWPNVSGYRLEKAKTSLKNLLSFWSYQEKTGGGFKITPLSPKG